MKILSNINLFTSFSLTNTQNGHHPLNCTIWLWYKNFLATLSRVSHEIPLAKFSTITSSLEGFYNRNSLLVSDGKVKNIVPVNLK